MPDELPVVAALVAACDLADLGYVEASAEDIREEWEGPGFELARDAWVVLVARSARRRKPVGSSTSSAFGGPGVGRGLGRALLEHAFAEFFRRGTPRVLLGVNTENPTGATRLYERAGMHVVFRFDRYEKALG